MSILWCGGEDIDFPNGTTPNVSTTSTSFRAGYARCIVQAPSNNALMKSTVFPGGAITSCWFSVRWCINTVATIVNQRAVGLGLSGTTKGLFVGSDSATATKLALCKYDGTTTTQLASEAGNSITGTAANILIHRIDMQVVNYGASATVNVYFDGVLVITYTGDVTVSGVTNLDSVFFNSTTGWYPLSEFIVADEDVRAFPGLVTLALTGAGTTDQWTGTFSNINGTTISDANPAFTNTNAQDEQFNWTDLPAGTFAIKAVRIAARMAKSASPAVTQVKLGYNSGGSVAFGTGATKALTTAYATYEQIDATNPVTAVAFVQSEMNALQVDAQSVT